MTAKSNSALLLQAWHEKWSPKQWVREVQNHLENGQIAKELFISSKDESLADLVTKYALSGTEPNQFYVSCLQEGLKSQVLPSVAILDAVTKMTIWDRPRAFMSAISIVKDTISFPSSNSDDNAILKLTRALARTVYWLLCHTAEALKACFKGMKTPADAAKLQDYLETLQGAQELISTLLDKEKYRDLVLVGKLDLEDEVDMVQLQMHLKELMNVQNENLGGHQDSSFVQESLKDLYKTTTRFLNLTALIMSHERKAGHIPSKLLQYFTQFTVAYDLGGSSQSHSDLLDTILRSENIPLDQFYLDLMRCSCHGILNAGTQEETFRWVSFFLFKVPSIIEVLKRKYKQTVGDNTIFFPACKQFVQFNTLLDDLDVKCRCRILHIFFAQCKTLDILDSAKTDTLLSLRKSFALEVPDGSPSADSFPVGVVLQTARQLTDVLKVLNSPLETHRDMIRQQLNQLAKVFDFARLIAVASGSDQYINLVRSLVRLNDITKHPLDSKEDPSSAEIRCEIFNLTFVFLFYITTVYGTKVLNDIEDSNAFFVTWRKNCTTGIGEKNYQQTSMDTLLDQLLPGTLLPAVSAKWDEHCLCAGEVIRELAQAVGCRLVNMDIFQRICEGFKNKRPALCIAASVWLCTQYKSLNIPDKDKTTKILQLFKRSPSQQQSRTELVSKALEKHALPYGVDQVAFKYDNIDGHDLTPQRINSFKKFLDSLAAKDHGLLFDTSTIEELKKHYFCLGPICFAENLVKAVLNCGYVEKSIMYGNIASIITLLDSETIVHALFQKVMLDIVRHKNAMKLLADPQGNIIAKFLGLVLAFYLAVPSKKDDGPKASKIPRLDLPSSSVFHTQSERERQARPFVIFLQELSTILSPSETSAVHVFLASLMENVAVSTAHLPRFLVLPDDVIEKLNSVLPPQLPREVILFICDVTTPAGRRHAAQPLSRHLLATS